MKRTKRFAWTLRNWKKRENTYKQFFKIMVIQRMYLKGDYRERQVHTTPERRENEGEDRRRIPLCILPYIRGL